MAQLVEVEPGDVLVFANAGRFPRECLPMLNEINERLDVKVFVFEGAAEVSVIRRALLKSDSDDEGGGE
jgi:hypothetical protein